MALPKWTDERTQQLTDFIGGESPVSQATVANAAEELETSVRSVSSKLILLSSILRFSTKCAAIISCPVAGSFTVPKAFTTSLLFIKEIFTKISKRNAISLKECNHLRNSNRNLINRHN